LIILHYIRKPKILFFLILLSIGHHISFLYVSLPYPHLVSRTRSNPTRRMIFHSMKLTLNL